MNIKRSLSALESRLARHRKAAAGAAGALALLLILFFPLNLFSGTTVLVLVREDTTPETFARSLEKERVAAPSFLLEAAYSLARTGGVQPSSGYYALTGTDSLATFALKLRRSNLSQGIFRIPEGAPIWAVRALLEKNSLTTRDFTAEPDSTAAEALSEKYPELRDVIARAGEEQASRLQGSQGFSLEGLLAPDTYFYQQGKSDLVIAALAMRHQQKVLASEWAGRDTVASSMIRTPYEALVLASLIEKETGVKTDRALVSSVFHNRLRKGMPLQTDPSVIYGLGPGFKGPLTKADLRRDTPWNTYTRRGLPPTPIAAPSRLAIHAALHPADTRYLYFVSRGDGTSQFSETLGAHNSAVDEFIRKRKN